MNRVLTKGVRIIFLVVMLAALGFAQAPGTGAASRLALPEKAPQSLISANTYFESSSQGSQARQVDPPGVSPAVLQGLRQGARGQVSISSRKSTGMASFVRASQGGDLLPANASRTPDGKALGFFAAYGSLFGVRDALTELVPVSALKDRYGGTQQSYQQVYGGVPVFAAILRVHLDARNQVTAVNGVFVPDLAVNTTPTLTAEQAAGRAVSAVASNPLVEADEAGTDEFAGQASQGSLDPASLAAAAPTLYVYRDGLIQDVAGPNLLVYEVKVTGPGVSENVYVNAHTGKIVNRYSLLHDALFRRVFEQNTSNQVWQEGDPFPGSLTQDQQNIVNFSGQSYYLFWNAFGIDSYDQNGAEMQTVNNDPRINCPNANWNGATTNYCNGVTSDDVVAHEWGHAYTDYTHNLIYQWQSGALNESYSDIWGEVVDTLNGMGTDSPAPPRSQSVCTTFTPAPPELFINSPAAISGHYAARGAAFGPAVTAAGITGNVVAADDGSANPTLACAPLVNAGAISGNIALVDRGTCGFTVKVKNAQNAGAIAVIVGNNTQAWDTGFSMGGADPTITIPSILVGQNTSTLIKGTAGVNASVRLMPMVEASYRWLLAEDSTAFGAAIRDMGAPNCRSHPGKVSDTEYHCATNDGGGVHRNSGIPNHGFSLLVDGGSYNGQAVTGIGVTKTAHIYWRAQSVYQTPTTNFNDHADSLQAACTDLIGQNLDALGIDSTDPGPSGEVITAADCAQVDSMIQAIELRLDPAAQCNFQPILQPNPPPICSTGTPNVMYREDFKTGLNSWTLTNQGVFSGWPGLDWVKAKDLPGGRRGPAAFAADPNIGNCDGGAGDVSGSMSMESPSITIGQGIRVVPYLVFKHYVATEAGWDGGNLKISINGGAYSLVPASAYTFNPYNATLQTPAAGNTNPLAGQPAFTGTNGGSLLGSWGQSQINLSALGVQVGDTIRLRYDFGMDGCTGNDGWYVDDVELVACKP